MGNALIPVLGTAVGALWLATALACPRRPRRGDEVAALVCARRMGQRDRLLLLALLATALLVASVVAAAMSLTRSGIVSGHLVG